MTLPYCERSHPFPYIVWGMFFHSMGVVFYSITQIQLIYAVVGLIGWYYILKGFYLMKDRLRLQIFGNQALVLYLYVFLCIVMVIRGYMIDYPYIWISMGGMINCHLFDSTYILPYLMPFVLIIPVEEYDFRPLVKISVILSLIVIISFTLFYDKIILASVKQSLGLLQSTEDSAESFRFYGQIYTNVAIIALCRRFVSTRVWGINTIALIITLLINLLAARRGTSATVSMLLLFDIYFFIKSLPFKYRVVVSVLIVALVGVVVYLTLNFSGFNYIKKRGFEDSRSLVDITLLDQMSDEEKIIGKGLNGRYYFNLHIANDYLGGWRYGSETGYYNLVLKGGYLLAWVYILFILYPAILGIFKSNNLLSKALGGIMLLSLLELYPYGILSFNLKFLVIWMGVAFNSFPELRALNDDEVYQHYFEINENSLDN